jgi:intracellular sulfur oxidation DsrE/DsrF family protein
MTRLALFAVLLMPYTLLFAQNAPKTMISGPVITGYGDFFGVDNLDTPVDTSLVYKVVFDIAASPDNKQQVNPGINTIARFVNMHTHAGVPLKNLQVAAVVHGSAIKDIVHQEAYRKRFGTDNPNYDLIQQLHQAGVEFYICGQTAVNRDILDDEIAEPVKVALSAMTILISLQSDQYQLIRF